MDDSVREAREVGDSIILLLLCVYNNIQLYIMPVFQHYVYRRSHTLAFNTNGGKKLNKFPTSLPSTPYRKLDVYWMPITMVTVLSLLDGETHMKLCFSFDIK